MKKKILSGIFMLALAATALTGCGSSNQASTNPTKGADVQQVQSDTQAQEDTKTEADKKLSGTLTMSGSTSMEKLVNALKESFSAKYPDVTVTAEFVGSGAGIEAVSTGKVDIGNSSRNLKDSEIQSGVVENIVAIDGIAVIVDKTNTVTDLTKDQLTSIYNGETKNWKDLGGADAPIVVIGREAGSGTRGAFEELLELVDACKYANELDSTGAVIAKVAATPGAIGYASLDAIDDTVSAVKLEGVEPTAENIKAGKYFLCRPFVMATKGEISQQSELVQEFFNYIKSDEGRAVVEKMGLINVD